MVYYGDRTVIICLCPVFTALNRPVANSPYFCGVSPVRGHVLAEIEIEA